MKGGFVLLDARAGAVQRVLPFQYNPGQLTYAASEIAFSCELDATDALASGDPVAGQLGIAPQLAALAEIASGPPPPDGPVLLFVWGAARVAAVTVVSLIATEEAFGEQLAPLRATVAIVLRVRRADELEPGSVQARYAIAYEASRKEMAANAPGAALSDLGIESLL